VPLLYYWRPDNYRHDLDVGAGYNLNQDNPLLHQIDVGDSLWAFTRTLNGYYAIAAELVLQFKTHNPPSFGYGRYRVWGNLQKSRYFKVEGQPDAEQVIRNLSCKTDAAVLGRAFQGRAAVRPITAYDHQVLSAATRDLPLEPRARILPEGQLEEALLLGDERSVAYLLEEQDTGIVQQRREYLSRQAPARNKQLVRDLQRLYEGRCQICLWSPRSVYGVYLCQGHHIHWLSRGGEDSKENMMLVCPNHHAAVHRCDAQLDYSDKSFEFGSHEERLQLVLHSLG
jgi:5-methylcytosine-specific restriction protein A